MANAVTDPYSPAGLAVRCGALTSALKMVLETLDEECSVELSVMSTIKVRRARQILAECRAPSEVTR